MRLRIPYAPGRAISIGGTPHPEAVQVQLAKLGHPPRSQPHSLVRVASAPGWMVLLVRYDRKADQ